MELTRAEVCEPQAGYGVRACAGWPSNLSTFHIFPSLMSRKIQRPRRSNRVYIPGRKTPVPLRDKTKY